MSDRALDLKNVDPYFKNKNYQGLFLFVHVYNTIHIHFKQHVTFLKMSSLQ